MAILSRRDRADDVVVISGQSGQALVPLPTPLTRLNYFDGKFLRADDLEVEQAYVRALVALSNRAGGHGLVHGLDLTLDDRGDALQVHGGMAIDAGGRVLLLPRDTTIGIEELIDASRRPVVEARPEAPRPRAFLPPRLAQAHLHDVLLERPTLAQPGRFAEDFRDCVLDTEAPAGSVVRGIDLYLVTLGHVDALCGEEEVFGLLCEDACATDVARARRVEGVVVRVEPLRLDRLPSCGAVAYDRRHLRSRVASAYFASERGRGESLFRRDDLASDVWCLGAQLTGGAVALGVLARHGATTIFLDQWIARRERIETPPRRYWAGRMAMRPWDVYLAQILQFQCQLAHCLDEAAEPGALDDPCRPQQVALKEARNFLATLHEQYTRIVAEPREELARARLAVDVTAQPTFSGLASQIDEIHRHISGALTPVYTGPTRRVLLECGIVELPPAGYLPVVPGSGITINEQVEKLLGEGVDLRYCIVRPDYVAHALEQAQHMERISLCAGLDEPAAKPKVDVLVPNGEIVRRPVPPPGIGFEGTVRVAPEVVEPEGDERAAPAPATDAIARLANTRLAIASLDRVSTIRDAVLTAEPTRPAVEAIDIHGAGRGDRVPSGGVSFHFAGVTEAPKRIIPDLSRALVEVFRPGFEDASILRRIRSRVPAVETTTLYRSSIEAATDARRLVSDLRADAVFEPRGSDFAATAGDNRVVNLWTTMQVDRNALDLAPGESTPVRMFADFATPGAATSLIRYQLIGEIEVRVPPPILTRAVLKRVSTGATGRRVYGRFRGSASQAAVTRGETDSDASAVELDLFLVEEVVDGRPLYRVILRRPGEDDVFLVELTWSPDPLTVTVKLDHTSAEETFTAVSATMTERAEVTEPGNVVHTLALSALEVVGASVGDPDFASHGAQLLFPAPVESSKDLTVHGTLEWVLFHRRRDKTCTDELAREAPPIARRYFLYHVRVPDEAAADAVRRALLLNDRNAILSSGLAPVDRVEFAGGLPVLTTNPESIRADYRATDPGDVLLYAAIATAPTSEEGEVLARSRLRRVQDVVAPISATTIDTQVDTLPYLSDVLAVPGTDGAAVLVSRRVETTCIDTYWLDARRMPEIEKYVAAKDVAALRRTADPLATRVGEARFRVPGDDLATDPEELKAAWAAAGGGTPERAFVFSTLDDEADTVPRAQALTALFGGAGAEVQEIPVTDVGDDCPVVTFLQPTAACHGLHRVDETKISAAEFARLVAAGNREALAVALSSTQRFATANFLAGSADFLETPEFIRSRWLAEGVTRVEATFVLGVPDGNVALERARGSSLADAIGAPPPTADNVRVVADLPGGCASITVFAPTRAKTARVVAWLMPPPTGLMVRAVAVTQPVRIELTNDLVTFTGNAIDADKAQFKAVVSELASKMGSNVVATISLVRTATDVNADARLASAVSAFASSTPRIADPSKFTMTPQVREPLPIEAPIFTEDDVPVEELIALILLIPPPPDTSIDTHPPAVTTERSATFTFSSPTAGATFESRVDGGEFAAATTPQPVTVDEGTHTFEVRARDSLGQVDPTPASFAWTVEPATVRHHVYAFTSEYVEFDEEIPFPDSPAGLSSPRGTATFAHGSTSLTNEAVNPIRLPIRFRFPKRDYGVFVRADYAFPEPFQEQGAKIVPVTGIGAAGTFRGVFVTPVDQWPEVASPVITLARFHYIVPEGTFPDRTTEPVEPLPDIGVAPRLTTGPTTTTTPEGLVADRRESIARPIVAEDASEVVTHDVRAVATSDPELRDLANGFLSSGNLLALAEVAKPLGTATFDAGASEASSAELAPIELPAGAAVDTRALVVLYRDAVAEEQPVKEQVLGDIAPRLKLEPDLDLRTERIEAERWPEEVDATFLTIAVVMFEARG